MTTMNGASSISDSHGPPGQATTGAGVLWRTEVEHVDLGEHRGRRFRARVEHRTLRLALARPWSAGITLGQRRPVAVEVAPVDAFPVDTRPTDTGNPGTPPGARRGGYDVVIATPADPWPRAARRMLFVALAGWLVVRLAHRVRGRKNPRSATLR